MNAHTTAAQAQRLSSLARFSAAEVVCTLQEERAKSRDARAAGRLTEHMHRQGDVFLLCGVLRDRGVEVPAYERPANF